MADLITVRTFIANKDESAEFLQRCQVALAEVALAERENMAATLTPEQSARQEYALRVLASQSAIVAESERMLTALAIKANDAGLISEAGVITATDTQIRATVAAMFTEFSQFIAPDAA